MSIIQQIRERAAWLVFGLIALSLIGFLLMDAFVGKSRMFGTKSTTIGSIDGENIEYTKFQSQVDDEEEKYKARGYQTNEAVQQSIRDNVWKQMIEDAILSGNYQTLGLNVSQQEIDDMLVGPNAIPEIRQAFTDQQTGIFDPQQAAERINQMRTIFKNGKKTDKMYESARSFFDEYIPQIIKMRLKDKYMSLVTNSAYVPKWMIEKTNADNSLIASISFVNTPYYTIPDSTVKVSDEEIDEWVGQHKDQFKQPESRSVVYVTFNDAPTAADSAKIRRQLTDMEHDFAGANNPEAYLARVGTDNPYLDEYVAKSKIQVPNKDSIFALPKGQLFGPYLDGNAYAIAKKVDEKTLPDSVRARHILVATVNPQSHQPIMDDSTAKKKIDSIRNLIEKGARFDTVAIKLSDDKVSAEKGGELGYFGQGTMVKEFNDFCFSGKKGDKKIVKSQFGYHYVEILDQKNFEPAYKIAYLARKIETSPETDQAAGGLANFFAGQSRDKAAFDQNAQKDTLQKLVASDIQPSEYEVRGLGANRLFVRWIYEASLGDVSEPFPIGDKYVVALLTEINKEGTMTAAKARAMVEPRLRNRKKAELILKKLGSPATLEAAVAAGGQPIRNVDTVLFSSPFIPNLGQESRVVGSAFDKGLAGKPASVPIPGNGGVFVIKVRNTAAKPNPNADIEQQRLTLEQQQRSMISNGAVEELKNIAKIKDDRGKFF